MNREEEMVRRYGECCMAKTAQEILGGVSSWYIRELTIKGKIRRCGERNRKVDVRSLARYLEGGADK